MLVMIGCHRVRADAWPGKGLWYDDALGYPESRVKQSWSRVAAALCGEWNVVLADLAPLAQRLQPLLAGDRGAAPKLPHVTAALLVAPHVCGAHGCSTVRRQMPRLRRPLPSLRS